MMIPLSGKSRDRLETVQFASLGAGVPLLVGSLVGGAFHPASFFPGYLASYLFWLGLGLGSMAILMVHHQVGGSWGYITRRILEAATGTLPLLVLFFVPLLFGRHILIPWADPSGPAASPEFRHLEAYMSPGGVIVRAGIYFLCWVGLARALCRGSARLDRTGDPRELLRLRRLSGGGLLLYAVTMFFAAVDWMLATEPRASSTIVGLIAVAGQVVSGFALVIAVLALLSRTPPLSEVVTPGRLRDLANLLLTAVLLWAYVSFSQYLIIWSGNLPREVAWYVRRTSPAWRVFPLTLLALHLAAPLALLLFRAVKERPAVLGSLAGMLLGLRLLEGFWQILPAYEPGGPVYHWTTPAAVLGMGGLWMGLFLRHLR